MKKLIGILAVLLITTTVSGQDFLRSLGFTERKELWKEQRTIFWEKDMSQEERMDYVKKHCSQSPESYEEQIIDYGFYYTHENVKHFRINTVHFIANGRVFMLSYEPISDRLAHTNRESIFNTNIIGKIYLYSKDMSDVFNPWEIASVEKIAGEYVPANVLICQYINHRNYSDVDFYIFDKDYHNTSIGKVVELNDGRVEMTIGSFGRGKFGNQYGGFSDIEPLTFVFTPVDDKHYTCEIK
jgi:hypothetical protein